MRKEDEERKEMSRERMEEKKKQNILSKERGAQNEKKGKGKRLWEIDYWFGR